MQVFHFCQDAFNVATAFSSACIGNDTVVAEVITTAHDTYKTTHTIAANALWKHVAIGFGCREIGVYSGMSEFAFCNHCRQIKIGIGTAYEACMMVLY